MRSEVTYGVSRIAHVLRSSCVRLYSYASCIKPCVCSAPQSCHGYLRALLKAFGSRLVASPVTSAHFIRHHPQAHLLAMS